MKTIPIFLSGCLALVVTALWVPPAEAWPTYSEQEITTYRGVETVGNCSTCHGNFRATDDHDSDAWLQDEYISPTDGETWRTIYTEVEADSPSEIDVLEIGLHDIHRHVMVDKIGRSRCDVCHFGEREDRETVFLSLSNGGEGLEAIGCSGCHGRAEDARPGAGLRQHHTNSGVNVCKTCHMDADPAIYTPVGEDVLPPYYTASNEPFVNLPTDPCNPHGEEDYAGGRQGLDNDGDGLYDKRDPDCRPIGPGNDNRP